MIDNNKDLIAVWRTLVDFDNLPCNSILDIGCGAPDDICDWWTTEIFKRAKIRIGVEIFRPALLARTAVYAGTFINESISECIRTGQLGDYYDVIIMSEVLEHLDKTRGHLLLEWAIKHGAAILINTPIGFLPNESAENPFMKHRSGWQADELRSMGFETSTGEGKLVAWKLR